ncbi:MAG: NADH-quinone oxidoreductase subunit J [Candidatus Nanopelagicales bacterium]
MTTTSLLATSNVGAEIVYWTCAILAIIGAVGMIASRKPVHSALFVAFTMINLAVLYVALDAPFLGMVQVIVYTGAVMMLFVFVMMVVGVDASDSLVETIKGQRWTAIVFVVGLAALLIGAIVNGLQGAEPGSLEAANAANGGNVQGIAQLIFTKYVIAFEVTSALLITAALGAMLLAHRERYRPKVTQEQLSKERFRQFAAGGPLPGNLPPAGTYARHNAVDTPALLPDGSTAPEAIPGSLQERGTMRPVNIPDEEEVITLSEGDSAINDPAINDPAINDHEDGEDR